MQLTGCLPCDCFRSEVDGELTANMGNVGATVEYVGLLMAYTSMVYL